MADSPSPVPESGLTLETTAEERAAAAAWLATDGCPEDQFDRRIIRDLTAAMQEIERLRSRADDTTWFWRIVDQDGLNNVPSDEVGALSRLVAQAARAESAEASARSARADALEDREALGSARIRIAALETLVLSCCDHEFMDDADEMLFEDILERRSGRSLKTAPKGDGEGK